VALQSINPAINQSLFFVLPNIDRRAAQLSLPHVGITKTEKIELKHKTDEQINPVNGLYSKAMRSVRLTETDL